MNIFIQFIYIFKTKSFWKLIFKTLRNPLFTFSTLLATYYSVFYAQKYFPFKHSGLGKGNAFRHAIWNALIAFYCWKIYSDLDKVLSWAEEITSYHENLFFNDELPKLMDLHNNKIGRNLFKKYIESTYNSNKKVNLVKFILSELKHSKLVSRDIEIENFDNMVYLEKD